MTYRLEFELAGKPKSTNQLLGAHYRTKHENAMTWKNLVAWAVKGKEPTEPLTKVKITLVRYNYRMLDFDGCVASFKPVVDGLVYSKIIKNDTYKITGPWDVTQEYRPKGQDGIKIIVEDAG